MSVVPLGMIRPEDPSASDPRKCVSGHLIPQGAPEGLCPQCMFLQALEDDEEETEDGHTDKAVLLDVQNGFKVKILELPKELDTSLYM